jgi:hypothetical protein
MAVLWQIDDSDAWLCVQVTGAYPGLKAFEALVIQIGERCQALQRSRVLLDLTAMTDPIPPLHRFLIGKLAARIWRRQLKVAVLAKPEEITRLFENVAVNAGANVLVFGEPEAAREWLRSRSRL